MFILRWSLDTYFHTHIPVPIAAELYFLLADFLARSTPCQRAATVLREELVGKERRIYLLVTPPFRGSHSSFSLLSIPLTYYKTEHGLLGLSYDWQGRSHQSTPEELSLRYRHLPRDQLPRLLHAALRSGDVFGNGVGGGGDGTGSSRGAAAATTSTALARGGGRGAAWKRGNGQTTAEGGSANVYVTSILTAVRGPENTVSDNMRDRIASPTLSSFLTFAPTPTARSKASTI